jgi:hypothetical protein
MEAQSNDSVAELSRGRAFWTAFGLASLIPIAAGAIAVFVLLILQPRAACDAR